jgi:hypothetical protein
MGNVRPFAHAVLPFEGREDKLIMEIRPDVIFKGYDHGRAGSDERYCMRAPGWKDTQKWDMIPAVHIAHLPGYSTTLKLKDAAL